MERPHDIAQQINDLLIRAADSISEFNPDFDPQIRTADERFGDFQANGILPFAKKNNLNPRELGEKLIASLPPSEDWEISGRSGVYKFQAFQGISRSMAEDLFEQGRD